MSLSRGRRVIENINLEIIQNLREKIETHVIVKYFSALLLPMISTYKLANARHKRRRALAKSSHMPQLKPSDLMPLLGNVLK